MVEKVNVLIFPAGAENALEIYHSLKHNVHFNVFGASAKADNCEFVYPKDNIYIGKLNISEDNFIDEFNLVIKKFEIGYVIPTHDTIAVYLNEHNKDINAKLITSPYETARIAENKKLTYEILKDCKFFPKIYTELNEIDNYPVFLKPYVGAGGKGTYLVEKRNDLVDILEKKSNMIICEYLPGREYTVDCFTNKHGELLFVGPRTRERITMGIAFRSQRAEYNADFENIARELNNKFKFNGAWFFQVKEDNNGNLKIMEFSVRQAGTMALYRQLGINFAMLSLFDVMGYDIKILFNDYKIILDRSLKNCYSFEYEYDKLYVDFDDTLIINNKVNTTLIKLIYQCVNKGKKIILITKHANDLEYSLAKHRICKNLFDEIILLKADEKKSDYIDKCKSILIDNYFLERKEVKDICKIPVFDVDAAECLIDNSLI